MKRFHIVLIVVCSIAFSLTLFAQEKNTAKAVKEEKKETTISGEVIDVKCYMTGMMEGKGEEHKECAISCIKRGLPAGILEDKTNAVYLVMPAKGMEGGSEALAKHAAQKVTMTGTLTEKGGQRLFMFSKIEVMAAAQSNEKVH